jgi:hypothetical protein
VQCSAVQCSAVQCSAVQCSAVQSNFNFKLDFFWEALASLGNLKKIICRLQIFRSQSPEKAAKRPKTNICYDFVATLGQARQKLHLSFSSCRLCYASALAAQLPRYTLILVWSDHTTIAAYTVQGIYIIR